MNTNKKRREAQLKLDRWKDSHVGPRWLLAQTKWTESQRIQTEIDTSTASIHSLTQNKGSADTWISILQTAGFLTPEQTLTKKGILATEFNEGHTILSSTFFDRGLHKDLTGEELVTLFACLLEEKGTDDTPTFEQLNVSQGVKSGMTALDEIVCEFHTYESNHQTFSPESYWILTTTWVEPVKRWLQGESASQICVDYGLFEGNFVRAILRIANMVDEWTAVATFMEDVDLLEKMNGIRQQLVRDFLVPDSLYLHL